jgi:hypothetical protein
MSPAKNSLFLASSVLAFWGLGRALRLRKPNSHKPSSGTPSFWKPGAWLLFWLFLLYPAVYYFVYCIPRYRHPIEPEIAILAVFLLTEAGRKTTASAPDQSSERESG